MSENTAKVLPTSGYAYQTTFVLWNVSGSADGIDNYLYQLSTNTFPFSLLFRHKTLQLSIACTDLHWTFFKPFEGMRLRSEETANHNNVYVALRGG